MAKSLLIFIIAFTIGTFGSYIFTQRRYNKSVEQLSTRIAEGEKLNQQLLTTNRELTAQNTRDRILVEELRGTIDSLRGEISNLRSSVKRARGELENIREIVNGIGAGLTEGADIIQSVIDGLEQIKNAVNGIK